MLYYLTFSTLYVVVYSFNSFFTLKRLIEQKKKTQNRHLFQDIPKFVTNTNENKIMNHFNLET